MKKGRNKKKRKKKIKNKDYLTIPKMINRKPIKTI